MQVVYRGWIEQVAGMFVGSVVYGNGGMTTQGYPTWEACKSALPILWATTLKSMHANGRSLPRPEKTEGDIPLYVDLPDGAAFREV